MKSGIRALGGVDLWLLGIGSNGHIAFNEPGSSRDSRTRCVQLTAETIADNSRLFAASTEVPRRAFTVGVGTIEARRVLLLATGAQGARCSCRTAGRSGDALSRQLFAGTRALHVRD